MKRNIKLDLDVGNSEWLSNVWKTGVFNSGISVFIHINIHLYKLSYFYNSD